MIRQKQHGKPNKKSRSPESNNENGISIKDYDQTKKAQKSNKTTRPPYLTTGKGKRFHETSFIHSPP